MAQSPSQFPFPNDLPVLTPVKEHAELECPGAPSRIDTRRENYYGMPSALVFEREELDDDSNTDDDEEEEPVLNIGDVVFLNKQLKLINDLHADLTESIKKETKNVRAALKAIRRAKQKTSNLEEQSWSICSLLGRTNTSDYIGL
jgi:hypothetical protein